MRPATALFFIIYLSVSSATQTRADVIAHDDASDAVYKDGWQGENGFVPAETGMDNGGTGFLPWDFEADEGYWEPDHSPYPLPHFIDTKPTSFDNLGAPTFAITNGNLPFFGFTTIATRPFAQPLRVGDQITVDIDNPVMQKLAEFDTAGFIVRLQTASKVERFGLFTTQDFNNNEWTINDSRGDMTGTGFTDVESSTGFKFAFKLTGEETYRLTLTPRAGGAPLVFEGTLAAPGKGAIQRIQFLMYGNGSGDGHVMATGEREFYFDNLLIGSSQATGPVQEPSDCNQDGVLDISDAVCLLLRLFLGGSLPCEENLSDPGNKKLLDANGDNSVDLSDAVWVLGFLFRGTAPPALGTECQPMDGCPDNSLKYQ